MQLTRAQLLQDLTTLPHGDLTLVGTQGVQLSGGQRARGTQIYLLYLLLNLLAFLALLVQTHK